MKSRPVVFIVIGQLDVGGAETHLARILPELTTENYEIVIFVFSGNGALEQNFRRCGITILCPPHREKRFSRLFQCALSLFLAIHHRGPSVMHFFLPEAYILGSIISLTRPGIVRIMSRRSLNKYQKRRPLLARLEGLMHRVLFGALANSRAVSEELCAEGFRRENVGLIYNGVLPHQTSSTENQQRLREDLGIAPSSIVILCIANIIPYKGHRDIIQALAVIDPEIKWHMVFVGEDRGILANLRANAKHLGLEDRISWEGSVAATSVYLDIADIAILASHEEGFSNFLLEAMSAGLPIIATSVGGNSDAVVEKETGILVPPREPQVLGKAISDLCYDPAQRTSMGKAGRERVELHFSHRSCVENYQRLYRNLTSKNKDSLGSVFPLTRQ